MNIDEIAKVLEQQEGLLDYRCSAICKTALSLPGPDFIDRIFCPSDRPIPVLRSLASLFGHGRLASSGYLSILPVDQGIEHCAGSSFSPNPIYFDPENIVKLAMEGGCSAVASTLSLALVARKYAHKIPFILKINHNELLSYPNSFDQTLFANVQQAYDMGAVAVGATVYFGSEQSSRQIQEISEAFQSAHELGMATILWCYLRNPAFTIEGKDFHESADLTGQANYIGATIGADIVKQKLPTLNGGYKAVNRSAKYGKYSEKMYSEMSTDHPIDLCRYQVLNGMAGRIGLINSGGACGKDDYKEAIATAVINKRAGGMGLISGRKAFQKPVDEGIALLHAVQDVYLCKEVTIA